MQRIAFLAFVLVAGAVHAGPEESAVQVVRLSFEDDDWGVMHAKTNYGSGTVVWAKDGLVRVLTCKHVVPDDSALVWVRSGKTLYQATFVAAADEADLALLECKSALKAAPVAAAEPKKGADVRQWGHPWAGRQKPKHGPAVGDDGHKDAKGRLVWVAGFGSEPGDSGAGVFDAAGCLCAVCRVRFDNEAEKAGCESLAALRAFLATNLPK